MSEQAQWFVEFGVIATIITLVVGTVIMVLRDLFAKPQADMAQRLGTARGSAIPQLTGPPTSKEGGVSQRIENWFGRLIYETGLNLTGETALLLEISLGLVVGGALFIWQEDLLLGITGFVAGMTLVVLFFMFWRLRRQRIMRNQMPDLLEHIARAVRAGRTVDEAIQMVGDSATAPLGIEFRRCGRQLGMGLSVEAAMRAMARRVVIPEMRIMASTFIVQRRAGGNLPTTLERLAKVIRDRLAYYRQYRAATAGARFSMMLILAAGPLVIMFLTIVQPEYFMRFFESMQGVFIFASAVVLYFIGFILSMFILRANY